MQLNNQQCIRTFRFECERYYRGIATIFTKRYCEQFHKNGKNKW